MNKTLEQLILKTKGRKMSDRERWDQRVSFVYGQLMDCNPSVSRDDIEKRAVELYGPRPE